MRVTGSDEEPARRRDQGSWSFDPSFGAVLAEARRGSEAGFAQLYQSLNRRVHSYVRLRGATDPEATVNEVFLKVFRNIETFSGGEAQFNAWVFTIARNTLIDERRASARRPTEVGLGENDQVEAQGDAEAEAVAAVGQAELLARLETLTAEQREVVLLRIVGDLTIESIADALGKEIGAVKALQRRAFRRLAREMSDEGVPQ